MTDTYKVSWFKRLIIVGAIKYLAYKEIDQSTMKGLIAYVSDYFKDKDERKVLESCLHILQETAIAIQERVDELEGHKVVSVEGEASCKQGPRRTNRGIKGRTKILRY